MPEQPFYKFCQFCFHYQQTVASEDKFVCTCNPTHINREADDTCGQWICSRCWIPWDMVTQDEASGKIFIIDHSKCPQVNISMAGLLTLEDLHDGE